MTDCLYRRPLMWMMRQRWLGCSGCSGFLAMWAWYGVAAQIATELMGVGGLRGTPTAHDRPQNQLAQWLRCPRNHPHNLKAVGSNPTPQPA